jgi:hypothetical protein
MKVGIRGTGRAIAVASCSLWLLASCGGDDGGGDEENLFGNATPEDIAGGAGRGGGDGDGDGDGDNGRAGRGGGDLAGMAVCKHVDLVIAVDGSSSMQEELAAMRDDIFPAFGRRLRQLGADLDDFRVATIDACPVPANFHTRGANGECGFHGGQRWIESSSDAMDAEFACVGDIFLGDQECSGENDDEQPATSALAALGESAHNGFRRDDALLVVIAITDEDEQSTGNARSPEEIYARFADEVSSDPRRMVFLGIGGRRECQGAYGEAEEADDLRELTDLFAVHDRGVFWDLCDGRLEDGLDEAFRVIENACNDLCGDLDEDCGSDPPGGGEPVFCQEFPGDPACSPE